ncbi:MAG: ribonuclease H-like domain-containing protein [Chloroflexi bacterium]|nr:ribonuclease H-like domain-containing protein [Chloroflexota bacterium]
MLKHTFLHIPGVGHVTEQKLWGQGFLCWEDCYDFGEDCALPPGLCNSITQHLEESFRALETWDARHFEVRLPPGEAWRLYPEFQGKTAYLDIETTGLYYDSDIITLIGLFDGEKTRVFVRGINLDEFAEEIKKYSLIVTFNGKRFDLPFISRFFGRLPPYQAHIDLLYLMHKLGYYGGLKAIERQLGIKRQGALREADGFIAVLLWHEYRRGNPNALDTLIRYNLEDVVNLQYLAQFAYNESLARLRIPVKPIPVQPRFPVDVPFDADLIRDLVQRTREFSQ